jgi:hypothetical protein
VTRDAQRHSEGLEGLWLGGIGAERNANRLIALVEQKTVPKLGGLKMKTVV